MEKSGSGNGSSMNVLALLKGDERYVFLYDDKSIDQLLQTLGRYAQDPELNFTSYDAAFLSQRVHSLAEEALRSKRSQDSTVRDLPWPDSQ